MTRMLSVKRNVAILLVFFALALSASAHSGKTDVNGGHYDKSTGIYHYHHGYPAHQHTGGRCPYDFDDKTGQSSGAPSTSDSSNHGVVLVPKITLAPTVTLTPETSSVPETTSPPETTSSPEITLNEWPFVDGPVTPIEDPFEESEHLSSSGSFHSGSSNKGGYSNGSSSSNLNSYSDNLSVVLMWIVFGPFAVWILVICISSARDKRKQKKRRAEEEARAEQERQDKLRELHATYDGKHILSFVDIPKGSEIGADNLPKETNAKENWGKLYTFYITKDGTSFHTKDCHYARYGRPSNALTVSRDHTPCKLCGATLPPLEWARECRKIKRLATEYTLDVDFTPPPSWYPPFVIRADQTTLSGSFIVSLDPARIKRAIEESFTITENKDKKYATVTHEGGEEGYTTSFTRCTCRDNSFRHAICKHMIALAIHKGALEIKQSKLPE